MTNDQTMRHRLLLKKRRSVHYVTMKTIRRMRFLSSAIFSVTSFVMALCVTALPALGSEAPDCTAMLADVDARIASGKYPDQNIMVARQMRPSITQMCEIMNAEQRTALLESFEKVLPTRSKEEQKALREARAAERKAARQARKTKQQAAAARRLAAQPALPDQPGGRSLGGVYLDRPEPMYHVYLWDWEVRDDALRVVYGSRPSREQYGGDDWTLNIYYAFMAADGATEHRRVRSVQATDHQALALRRGYDEIILERNPGRDQPLTLERWAIDGSGRIATADITNLDADSPGNRRPLGLTFRQATDAGHLLYDGTWTKADNKTAYGWCAVAVTGQIVACHTFDILDKVSSWAPFPYSPGGGLVVNISPASGTALKSSLLDDPDADTIGAGIDSEQRVLALGQNSALAWQAPIEREMHRFSTTPGPNATLEEQMALLQQHRTIGAKLRMRHDANRKTRYEDIGLRRVVRIRETENGVAFLTKVAADRQYKERRGLWLMEVGPQGELNRFHLEPLADMLDVRLSSFAPFPGGYYIYAQSMSSSGDPGRVFKLDTAGKVLDYGVLQAGQGVRVRELIANADGVWVIGEAYEGKSPGRVWLERIVFD